VHASHSEASGTAPRQETGIFEFLMMGFRRNIIVVAAAAILLACSREAPAPQEVAEPAPAAATQQTVVAPSTELAVRTVESVMVSRPQDAPASVVIQASGTVPTTGWSEPKLVPVEDSDPSSRSFSFVATSPPTTDADDLTEAVEASLQIDTLPPEVKTIRIVSGTNAVSAFLP
jgi:hypothetical protein